MFDLGPNALFLENARKMGVDISEIDTVVISHGHKDHAGALKLFLENNKTAKVYIRENAFDKHFTKVLGIQFCVGIDSSLKSNPQIVLTDKRTLIDDELMLFSDVDTKELYSKSNNALYTEIKGKICLDDFSHEQNLIITEGENKVLFAGCSHSGIVNIKNKAESIVDSELTHVIAGFHLYNPVTKKAESVDLVQAVADKLNNSHSRYYTCHCTGQKAFGVLKEKMADKISYLSTGAILEL